jgi:hypothetical protein
MEDVDEPAEGRSGPAAKAYEATRRYVAWCRDDAARRGRAGGPRPAVHRGRACRPVTGPGAAKRPPAPAGGPGPLTPLRMAGGATVTGGDGPIAGAMAAHDARARHGR